MDFSPSSVYNQEFALFMMSFFLIVFHAIDSPSILSPYILTVNLYFYNTKRNGWLRVEEGELHRVVSVQTPTYKLPHAYE